MPRPSKALIDKTFKQLFELKQLNQESILILHALFSDTLLQAIHIAESKSVAKIKSNSGRVVFRVSDLCLYPEEERVRKEKEDEEEIENIFTCLLFPRYCSCETFLKDVILQDELIMCRHLLAIMISHALNISENIQLNDEDFAEHYYSWVA